MTHAHPGSIVPEIVTLRTGQSPAASWATLDSKAGSTAEEILQTGLPHISPAAIYEAIAYYYDHQAEIEAELAANTQEVALSQLRERLSSEQYARLTGQIP